MVCADHLTIDARGAKEDKEEMSILEYDFNDKRASNE